MVLTLYLHPYSQPCRTVWMFCKVTRIPLIEKHLDIRAGEHKKPWFAQINPMAQVPTIRDGKFVLSESVAIVKYLIGKYDVNDHWYPADLEKRAKVDEFLAWHHMNLRQKLLPVFRDEVVSPILYKKKVEQSQLDEHLKDANKALEFLQDHLLKDQEYLFGDEISIADMFAVTEIIQTNVSGRDMLKDYPKLRQWFDLIRATLTPVFDEVHSDLFEFRDRIIAGNKEEKREEKVKQIREVRRRESTEPEGEVIELQLDDNLNVKNEETTYENLTIKEEIKEVIENAVEENKQPQNTEATVHVED